MDGDSRVAGRAVRESAGGATRRRTGSAGRHGRFARFNKTEIARDYHRQFPHAATLTLARRMAREQPRLWPTLEVARSALRLARGNLGQRNRARAKPDCYRPNGKAGMSLDAIPEGRKQLGEWQALRVGGPFTALVISDLHIPYHAAPAIRIALTEAKQREVNVILLNGDVVDHYGFSSWEKDPRERNTPVEVATTKEFLAVLRASFPKARIIWKEGNHEERFYQYMRRQAPDLLGIDIFTMQACYGLDNLGIELVTDKRPVNLGKLSVIHGHEYTFAITNPVNPARGLFLRAKVHALCGHFHQSSQHSETNLKGEIISTFSTACLADLHPDYRPLNNWGHGYAIVEVDKGGAFEVSNRRIVEGRAY